MKKLFHSKKKVTAIGVPDAEIISTKSPFVQYEQFLPDKQYIVTIMISKNILRVGTKKSLLQKT